MMRSRQQWTADQANALKACLARNASLAEAMADTGKTERQVKDRVHNMRLRLPRHWGAPKAGFEFPGVSARGGEASQRLAELNINPNNPRLALRRFSWETQA